MKTISKKAEPDALFQTIVCDFSFPDVTDSGEKVWKPSKFSFELLFRRMLADEALFEALRKSKGLTYVFEKTLTEISIRQESPAGRQFYQWIGHTVILEPPVKYELSPESMLLSSIAHQLGLNAGHFSSQPDPKALVMGTVHNVLQGELIDSFGCRVFEVMQRAAFKETIRARQKEIQSAISKTERYFGRLENNSPYLGIQRFELHYRPDPSVSISIQENAKHLDSLIAMLQEQDALGAFVGYWWKRRYLPEKGLGIHLILLTDMKKPDPMAWASRQTPEIWKQVSNGHGIACELSDVDAMGNHRCWGAKKINIANTGHSSLAEVLKSIRFMQESEKYLRLEPHPKIAHWGMGELPKAVIRTVAWQDSGQVEPPVQVEPLFQVKSPFDVAKNIESVPPPPESPEVPGA